jgi:hypothetical protein
MSCFSRTLLLLAATLAMGIANANAVTVTDDFSDGNDTANPAWTHLSGFVGSTNQSWTVASGQYRLQAPNNGFSQGNQQFGFVGSQAGPVYTDVNVMADFVQPATGGLFGVAARMTGTDGAFNTAGRTQGYLYGYEPTARGGLGEVTMFNFGANPFDPFDDMGDPSGVEGVDWIRKVTLDLANKDYTFSITAVGNTIRGEVREVGGGLVAFQTHTDSTHTSGVSGVLGAGVTVTGGPAFPTDFTIDNFKTQTIPEPATGLMLTCGMAALMFFRRRQGR